MPVVLRCWSFGGQECVQETDRAAFVQGFVAIAAFGGLDAGRAAAFAFAGRDGFAGGRQPVRRAGVAAFGETGAAFVAVVHEHREQARIGVQLRGDAADVPAVAGGEQRQQADRGVLGGMGCASEVDARFREGATAEAGSVHQTARVRSVRGGRSSGSSPSISPEWRRLMRYETTCLVTSTWPKCSVPGPSGWERSVARMEMSVMSRANVE